MLQVDNDHDHGWWRHWSGHHQQLCSGHFLLTIMTSPDYVRRMDFTETVATFLSCEQILETMIFKPPQFFLTDWTGIRRRPSGRLRGAHKRLELLWPLAGRVRT